MAKDRAKDARRTVGSHQEMMGTLGRAIGWGRETLIRMRPEKGDSTSRKTSVDLAQSYRSDAKYRQSFIPGAGNIQFPSPREDYFMAGTEGIQIRKTNK